MNSCKAVGSGKRASMGRTNRACRPPPHPPARLTQRSILL